MMILSVRMQFHACTLSQRVSINQQKFLNMSDQLKFSPLSIHVKERIRRLRLDAGYSMTEGSKLLGVSRKQLEDIETSRDYGCHLELELLAKIRVIYKVSLDELLGNLPADAQSDYFIRKRRRNAG